MDTAAEYLAKTESAVRKLFEGVESYMAILRSSQPPVFCNSYSDEADLDSQLESWAKDNESAIRASIDAQRKFMAESFAQATLCGSILQVAAKAIECYSINQVVPSQWSEKIKPGTSAVPFCIGRLVRGVPLGLIIYAARNQHIHFEDATLREPSTSIFSCLANNHGYSVSERVSDPAFDLNSSQIVSMSNNVTALIGWRSYDAYSQDMHALLHC